MSPSDYDHLTELAEALDRETTFHDGPGIRNRVLDLDVSGDAYSGADGRTPANSGGRSRYVLAMAAVVSLVVAGGAVFTGLQGQAPIGVIEPSADSATPGDAFDESAEESQGEQDATDETNGQPSSDDSGELVVDAPEPNTGPSTSVLSAPTTARSRIDSAQATPAAGEDPTTTTTTQPQPADASTTTTADVDLALPTETVVEVQPTESRQGDAQAQRAAKVYDGFALNAVPGPGGAPDRADFGFTAASSWGIEGSGTILSLRNGLDYTDSAGRYLITYPGSLRVVPVDRLHLQRPIEGTYDPADVYYVSFVINVTSAQYGDAFWTPPDALNRGGFGVQQFPTFRFVNGANSAVNVVPGVNHFVVGRLSDGLAEMWINPDLANPGPADVVQQVESVPLSSTAFSFSNLGGGGEYVLDEVRMGYNWRAVAPFGG